MCLIITVIMFILAIQNLMQHYWMIGSLELVLALFFLFMLWRNIQAVQCSKNTNCNNCSFPDWISKYFTNKKQK